MRKADAVLASIDSQHSWQQTQAVVEMAEELQAACLAGQSWLDSQAEQQIAAAAADAAAAAEGEAGAHGGYLHAHERDAAELQAALAAMAEQQEDGGWTSVGARGGTASRPATAAAEEEEEDMEESHGVRRRWGCGIGGALAGQRLVSGWTGGAAGKQPGVQGWLQVSNVCAFRGAAANIPPADCGTECVRSAAGRQRGLGGRCQWQEQEESVTWRAQSEAGRQG